MKGILGVIVLVVFAASVIAYEQKPALNVSRTAINVAGMPVQEKDYQLNTETFLAEDHVFEPTE